MYEHFYGLTAKPFQLVPDPQTLFLSSKHQNALTYLEYGISEGAGFVLLTGEIGTGKTTLIRHLLNQVEAAMEVAVIFNTIVSPEQLLNLILQEYELPAQAGGKPDAIARLYDFLIQQYARGKKTVLIIDEAQNLSFDALEEVRMLSNLQTDDQALLQIVLVGQPELKAKLGRPEFFQLAQRIAVSFHLAPLSREEAATYIAHRLQKAGGNPNTFSARAVEEIFRASQGVPRIINLLCDSALVYGYADDCTVISGDIVRQVIHDKGGIGLFPEQASKTAGVREARGPAAADWQTRLSDLEARVTTISMQLAPLLAERSLPSTNPQVLESLRRQLQQERKRYLDLLKKHAALKQELEDLKAGRR